MVLVPTRPFIKFRKCSHFRAAKLELRCIFMSVEYIVKPASTTSFITLAVKCDNVEVEELFTIPQEIWSFVSSKNSHRQEKGYSCWIQSGKRYRGWNVALLRSCLPSQRNSGQKLSPWQCWNSEQWNFKNKKRIAGWVKWGQILAVMESIGNLISK